MSTPRLVHVAPERLAGWVQRFAASHGEVSRSVATTSDRGASPSSSLLLTAADGSWARLTSWTDAPNVARADAGVPDVEAGGAPWPGDWTTPPVLLVVLVRRGGFAVAVATPAGELAASKVGTRHVQSRTAAGGWSQQRYARRRSNQADALVEAVVGHAARVLGDGEAVAGTVGGLVLGGDRSLTAQVLQELATGPRSRLLGIPRRELPDLPDPRRAVLDDAVARGRAVLVEVVNA
jgi:hypothetical protein